MYKRLLSVVLLLAFVAASGFKVSASPKAQGATCADSAFVSGVGKDLSDLGEKFKTVDLKNVAATSQLFLTISSVRQKYEDLNVGNECLDLLYESILSFSNASDILALGLAAQTDTANADAYSKVLPDQLNRFGQITQNVLLVAGVATPPAGTTVQGRISSITSTTCADNDFRTNLGNDFKTFAATFGTADLQDMASISKTLLGTISLRQKYEDLKAPSGCEVTQMTTVIALANAGDLLGLGMAIKADASNADAYKKALEGQAARTKDLLKKVTDAVGGAEATPAATAAAQ